MSCTLPDKGLWHVSDQHRPDAAPFEVIKIDLRGNATGTVRARNLETRLRRIRITGPDRFQAVYDVRGNSGSVEATLRQDGSLRLVLSGTAAGMFVACAAAPAMADAPLAAGALAGAVDVLCHSAGMARAAAG